MPYRQAKPLALILIVAVLAGIGGWYLLLRHPGADATYSDAAGVLAPSDRDQINSIARQIDHPVLVETYAGDPGKPFSNPDITDQAGNDRIVVALDTNQHTVGFEVGPWQFGRESGADSSYASDAGRTGNEQAAGGRWGAAATSVLSNLQPAISLDEGMRFWPVAISWIVVLVLVSVVVGFIAWFRRSRLLL